MKRLIRRMFGEPKRERFNRLEAEIAELWEYLRTEAGERHTADNFLAERMCKIVSNPQIIKSANGDGV